MYDCAGGGGFFFFYFFDTTNFDVGCRDGKGWPLAWGAWEYYDMEVEGWYGRGGGGGPVVPVSRAAMFLSGDLCVYKHIFGEDGVSLESGNGRISIGLYLCTLMCTELFVYRTYW